jgi:photoactive yellow protein
MFEEVAPSSDSPVQRETVHTLTDEQLDALPFGVIALDEQARVLRYNLYESRLARLDRNDVIGRHFFDEIARCTKTVEFEGRYRALLAEGGGKSVRFDYLFDFAFGAQSVAIEMVRVPTGVYVLVNRKKIAPPRPEFPRDLLAVRQTELAPDEGTRGVRRDARERRVVETPYTFLAALRATCDRLAPETWPLFANEWGVQWGRRLAVELEASALERASTSLGDLPMREAAHDIAEHLKSLGFGALAFDFGPSQDGIIRVDLARSALAEAARKTTSDPGALSCHLIAGCLAGVLSSLAQRRLAGREIACVASRPGSTCTLVIVGHERRGLVDEAIARGVRDLEGVRRALRARPGAR